MSKRLLERPRTRTVGGLAVLFTAFVAVLAFTAGGAAAANNHAASTTGATTYASKPGTVMRISSGTTMPQGLKPELAFAACSGVTDLPLTGSCSPTLPQEGSSQAGGVAGTPPHIASGLAQTASGNLLTNFNGISDVGSHSANGFHVTPPDQGLCVGPAGPLEASGIPLGVPGGTTVVVEGVNLAFSVYTTGGTLLYGPDTLANLFSDPYASGDISCNYDPAGHTYYFTEIGFTYDNNIGYLTDVAVMNPSGYSAYQVDTAEGGYCFPDFPQQGFDNNAFYITIDEFCGASENFFGSNVYAISKQQLASHAASPNGVYWDYNALPVAVVRPAIGDGTNTEYLLNSNDFVDYGVPANTLDLWQVSGDNTITGGHGDKASLAGTTIASETYYQPIPAASTGDGTTCVNTLNTGPNGQPPNTDWCVIPEAYLDPVDLRLEQVQYSQGQLYTSLSTAMTIGSDPTVVDGAAWFQVDPKQAAVVRQGYVGVAGTNLLMPSFVKSKSGTFMMGFSMTSPTVNPSAGYVTSTDLGNSFSPVTVTGAGSGPHVSFSDLQPGYLRARWGDYSAIALDPVTGNVWMADEYIPPADQGGSDLVDNWGTRVWEVKR